MSGEAKGQGSGAWFNGAPSHVQTSSIFAQIEPGQSTRGVYLGCVKGRKDLDPEQPMIYSPRAGRCFVWRGHFTLLQALSTLAKFTPVHIVRGADSGARGVKNYTVTSWPVVPEKERAPIITAERAAIAELATIRAKAAANPAPSIEAGPGMPGGDDSDLPF